MYSNEKRRSSGAFLPNLYFALEVIIVLLVLSLVMQLVELFNLDLSIIIVALFISMFLIMYFLIKRKKVLQRQDFYHKQKS